MGTGNGRGGSDWWRKLPGRLETLGALIPGLAVVVLVFWVILGVF